MKTITRSLPAALLAALAACAVGPDYQAPSPTVPPTGGRRIRAQRQAR